MSLAALFPPAIMDTILTRLATLFLSGADGDTTAARQAAAHMLDTYRPETEDELRLAANIIGFGFHALEALGQAAVPDIPITRILRLRGSAVSLSRESAKAAQRLDHLQKTRGLTLPIQPAKTEPVQTAPEIAAAIDLIDATSGIVAATKASRPARIETYEDRQRAERIAASVLKAELMFPAQAVAALPGAIAAQNARALSQAI